MTNLDASQIQQFISHGFVRLDNAFSRELAEECRAILWRDTGCEKHDPTTWTKPVIRLGDYAHPLFQQAANTPQLHAAFDQLVGKGNWQPRHSLGTFPIRFPHADDPGDAGWHIDASFADERSDEHDYFSWRVNVYSKERALLMLFLFSDVSEQDAPTRIRIGSHFEIAKQLEPAGEAGLGFTEIDYDCTAHCAEAVAVGAAGTVYLCHPFLVHAAQSHHGKEPRFIAQPPLYTAQPFRLHRDDNKYSPVEIAIRRALEYK